MASLKAAKRRDSQRIGRRSVRRTDVVDEMVEVAMRGRDYAEAGVNVLRSGKIYLIDSFDRQM